MSAILKMLDNVTRDDETFVALAYQSLPELQRLVSWVESAEHKELCGYNSQLNSKDCNCGLSELLSLIRS